MSALKYNCSLCCKNDLLLKNEFGLQAIRNTFFALNKNNFDEAFVKKTQFCVICTHKVQLSVQLKKEYDEMCNRNNNFSPKKCYFCEGKTAKLINLNDNPNNSHDTINVFLNSAIIRHEYKNLKSCIKCLYNLDVWSNVRSNLYKSMNIPTTNLVRNEDATNNNNNVASSATAHSPITSSKRRKQTPRKNIATENRKIDWKNYLHERLKNLQAADKFMEQERVILNSSTIENDKDKLFKSLPFVEIFVSSQINIDTILQDKEGVIPTIVLSDSDSGERNMNRRLPVRRLKLSLKKTTTATKNTPKQINKPTPKNGSKSKKKLFKIKLPIKSKLSLKKSLNVENSETDKDNGSESSELFKDSSSESESNDFLCNVCDKTFTSKCDYLLHDLKHKKIENLVVNVRRDRLFEKLNIYKTTQDQTLSSPDVNRLLNKWLGKTSTEFEDDTINEKEDEESIEEKSIEDNNKESEVASEESPKKKRKDEEEDKEAGGDNKEAETGDEMEVETTETSTVEEKNQSESENENDQISTNTDDNHKEIATKNNDSENESCSEDDDQKGRISDTKTSEKSKVLDKSSNRKIIDEDSHEVTNENNERSEENSQTVDDVDEKETEDPENCRNKTKTDDDNEKNSENGESTKKSLSDKINDKANGKSNEKSEKNLDFNDDSSNLEEISSTPVMSCEDLLNILETDIDSELNKNDPSAGKDVGDEDKETTDQKDTRKRKRESIEEDVTPKKKKVRFAEKKEVFTPNKSGVVIETETLIENDELSQDHVNESGDEETEEEKKAEEPQDGTEAEKEEEAEVTDEEDEKDAVETKDVNEDADQVLECEV